jgi:hypothetical protein
MTDGFFSSVFPPQNQYFLISHMRQMKIGSYPQHYLEFVFGTKFFLCSTFSLFLYNTVSLAADENN